MIVHQDIIENTEEGSSSNKTILNTILNIGTHNVKGLNKIDKQNFLFTNYEYEYYMDFIGLTETKIKKNEEKYFGKTKKYNHKIYLESYQTWWTGSNVNPMGAGVSLAIKKTLAQHVCHIEKLDGRAIKAHLQFKGKFNLTIIVTYVHASVQDKKERLDLIENLKKWITKAKLLNHFVLIMGDFNADPDKFQTKYGQGDKKIKDKYRILQCLYNLDLVDTTQYINVLRQRMPKSTWKGNRINKNGFITESRIDQIWISQTLLRFLTESEIYIVDEDYQTDHNIVKASFNMSMIFNKPSPITDKRLEKRKIFNIDEMNEDDWKNFEQDITDEIKIRNLRYRYFNVNVRSNIWINGLWNELHAIMIKARNNRNKFKFITRSNKSREEQKIDKYNKQVKFLLKVRKKLRSKVDDDIEQITTEDKNRLFDIAKSFDNTNLKTSDDIFNLSKDKQTALLNNLINTVRILTKAEEIIVINDEINAAIEK